MTANKPPTPNPQGPTRGPWGPPLQTPLSWSPQLPKGETLPFRVCPDCVAALSSAPAGRDAPRATDVGGASCWASGPSFRQFHCPPGLTRNQMETGRRTQELRTQNGEKPKPQPERCTRSPNKGNSQSLNVMARRRRTRHPHGCRLKNAPFVYALIHSTNINQKS